MPSAVSIVDFDPRWRADFARLNLESSSILLPALRLYESAGFVHHPAPRPGSHYARADVHMVWAPPCAVPA